MRFLATTALAALLALPAGAIEFTRIQTERAFRDFVVDRTLVDEFGGRLILGRNGSVSGQIDSNRLRGGWVWKEGHLCRRLLIGTVDQGVECQTVYVRPNQVVIERPHYGQSLSYTIQN